MQTNKKIYWIAQLVGWGGYSTLIYLSAYLDRPSEITYKLLFQLVFITFFSILYTHLMRLFMLRMKWLEKKLVALIPRLILISFTCSFFIEYSMNTFEYLFLDRHDIFQNYGRSIINILAITMLVICWNGIYFTFHFFQKSRQQELDNVTLEAAKNEIELKNLRSQLNPHFLFNSLNSIRALIDMEPHNAKQAVTTLSNLLRKSLLSGKENLILLSDEIEIVSNYLELEKIRFEERLNVSWHIDEELKSFPIPPFIIQTLVENAIKHGISKRIEGGNIEISTFSFENDVYITVENSGQLGTSSDTGIGISNIHRRLAIQYKGNASFSIKQEGENVLATLKFSYENH